MRCKPKTLAFVSSRYGDSPMIGILVETKSLSPIGSIVKAKNGVVSRNFDSTTAWLCDGSNKYLPCIIDNEFLIPLTGTKAAATDEMLLITGKPKKETV